MLSCSDLRLVDAIHLSFGSPWWVKPSQGHRQTYGNIAHREIVLGFDVSSPLALLTQEERRRKEIMLNGVLANSAYFQP